MIFIKFLIFIFLSVSLYSEEMYFDTISLAKVKKLIKKEERIAKAYKQYIIENGTNPALITSLTLPKGFSDVNLFGSEKITLNMTTTSNKKAYIVNEIPTNIKTSLYDEYYSNKNRVYTKAPNSKENNNIQIVLSKKEQYILEHSSKIHLSAPTITTGGYYLLDDKGILHWYDETGKILYSYDDKLIVYPDAKLIDNTGAISDTNLTGNNVLYPGQKILNIEDNIGQEYVNIGGSTGIIKVSDTSVDIGKTVIQFGRSSGGVIINGDIYTWGNNANQILGLGINDYSGEGASNRDPVVTGLVRAKAKTYIKNVDDKNYFSSPLRPKFEDLFASVSNATCGITVEGALYCGGTSSSSYSFGNNFTDVLDADGNLVSKGASEMLYRSKFFNGVDNKALKIFANDQLWLILSKNGDIYTWGYDKGRGFSGKGKTYNYANSMPIVKTMEPEKINVKEDGKEIKFSDITYLLTNDYRKIGALSQSGDIYIWGIESGENCENNNMDLCKPLKVKTNVIFKSIKGGMKSFVGISVYDKFYKIYQEKDKEPSVISIDDAIKSHSTYNATNDTAILSVDISNIPDSESDIDSGIVWVNDRNELKGDYFTSENINDDFFKAAIAKIKWKKIKVIQDDNGMCGIDTSNQMYCWGNMSVYRTDSSTDGSTFMLPVFNTNLYDLDKDFLLVEGSKSGYLTKMTSGDWNPPGNDFFMKYPTYIGGFNYEFTFK